MSEPWEATPEHLELDAGGELTTDWDGACAVMRACAEQWRRDKAALGALRAENERLMQWVDDLQSGMFINCVYCGHRYGPNDKVPASMADVLKQHIAQCPQHPMSALTARVKELEAKLAKAEEDSALIDFLQERIEAQDEISIFRTYEDSRGTVLGPICGEFTRNGPPWIEEAATVRAVLGLAKERAEKES